MERQQFFPFSYARICNGKPILHEENPNDWIIERINGAIVVSVKHFNRGLDASGKSIEMFETTLIVADDIADKGQSDTDVINEAIIFVLTDWCGNNGD